MSAPSVAQFKKWAHDHAGLAYAVVQAQAYAQTRREQVDAYIAPVFEDFGPFYRADRGDTPGARITKPADLYMCGVSAREEREIAAFYEVCDAEHRKHGFTGPPGHCPALVAEDQQRIAEGALIKAGAAFMDFDPNMVWGEKRKQLLGLLLGACLKARDEQRGRAA